MYVTTQSGHVLPVKGRVDMELDKGLRYDPNKHEIVETMFAAWARSQFLNPDLFTYRHRLTGAWMLAQWLDAPACNVMVELWGTEPEVPDHLSIDQLMNESDLEEVLRKIRLATAFRGAVVRLVEERRREEARQLAEHDREALETRNEQVKHLRNLIERKEGRLSGETEKHFDDIMAGRIPFDVKF